MVLKEKYYESRENLIVCVLRIYGRVRKTHHIFIERDNFHLWKYYFHLKRNDQIVETLSYIFYLEDTKPHLKTSSYSKAQCVRYSYIHCPFHCNVCSYIWHLHYIKFSFEWGFSYWYVYVYIIVDGMLGKGDQVLLDTLI